VVNSVERRGAMIDHLEDALALADEIQDRSTGYLIERALDEAQQFRLGREKRWCSDSFICIPRRGRPEPIWK